MEKAKARGYFAVDEYPGLRLGLGEFQQLMELLRQRDIPVGAPEVSTRKAVSIVNDLRKGIPPSEGISFISVGREELLASIHSDLAQVERGASQVRFVNADLGQGKTHVLHLLRDFAFSHGFVVSMVTLSQVFCPLHEFLEVYREVICGMRTAEERRKAALASMLQRWLEEMRQLPRDRVAKIVRGLPEDVQNAMVAYHDANNPVKPSMTKASLILEYLSAGKVYLRDLKPLGISCRIEESQALQMIGTMARLFKNLKYRGLCVLFDEAEAIHSLSRVDQQERAYENLLRIATDTATFPYCYFVYSTTPSFFDAYSRFWPRTHWIDAAKIYELKSLSSEEMVAVGR
ncbi:MAG: DUF2791 family P-loop domain-containing protein [Bacillota bacterium]|nr:DUF2791 family P-loop domain-containing protein [Bacillota bacterium]